MKLIIIYGDTAVGKLTTAKELSKNTGYPVLHNHMTIDLVEKFFVYNSEPFNNLIRKIRIDIVDELLKQDYPGLIWTTGFPNTKTSLTFYKKLSNLIKKNNGGINYVKLVCDFKEREKRVLGKDRKKYNKDKTILDKKTKSLDFSIVTPIKNTLVIDNTHLSSKDTALKIINFLSWERNKK